LLRGNIRFEIDTPGKDSDLLRQAGTVQVVVASAQRTLLINASDRKPELQTLVYQSDFPPFKKHETSYNLLI